MLGFCIKSKFNKIHFGNDKFSAAYSGSSPGFYADTKTKAPGLAWQVGDILELKLSKGFIKILH